MAIIFQMPCASFLQNVHCAMTIVHNNVEQCLHGQQPSSATSNTEHELQNASSSNGQSMVDRQNDDRCSVSHGQPSLEHVPADDEYAACLVMSTPSMEPEQKASIPTLPSLESLPNDEVLPTLPSPEPEVDAIQEVNQQENSSPTVHNNPKLYTSISPSGLPCFEIPSLVHTSEDAVFIHLDSLNQYFTNLNFFSFTKHLTKYNCFPNS